MSSSSWHCSTRYTCLGGTCGQRGTMEGTGGGGGRPGGSRAPASRQPLLSPCTIYPEKERRRGAGRVGGREPCSECQPRAGHATFAISLTPSTHSLSYGIFVEAQRGSVTCPWSPSERVAEPELEHKGLGDILGHYLRQALQETQSVPPSTWGWEMVPHHLSPTTAPRHPQGGLRISSAPRKDRSLGPRVQARAAPPWGPHNPKKRTIY